MNTDLNLVAIRKRALEAVKQEAVFEVWRLENWLLQVIDALESVTAERDDLRRKEANFLTYGQGGASYAESQFLEREVTIAQLVDLALFIEGAHHKQWYLEQIAALLGLDLSVLGNEPGVQP